MKNYDLEFIYNQLKDKYDLVLTNTFALNAGYEIDVPVLCGSSALGRFELYKEDANWEEFVFTVEFATPKKHKGHHSSEQGTHWHPQSLEEAMTDVIAFMEGTHQFCL